MKRPTYIRTSFFLIVFSLFAFHFLVAQDIPRTKTGKGLKGTYFKYADAEKSGVNVATLDSLGDLMEGWVRDEKIMGGELLIVKDGKVIFHEVAGWNDKEKGLALERNTIYRIRSMTKPFVGMAVLMLEKEGKLFVDDKVARHLPSFDNEKCSGITIKHLLTHKSGFPQGAFPEGYWEQPDLATAVDLIGAMGPEFAQDDVYRYSDLNSAILGAIIVKHTGDLAEKYIESEILKPLKLKSTFAYYSPDMPWAERMNSTYQVQGDSLFRYWDNTMEQQVPFFRASGGMYTSTIDYARFMSYWMNYGQEKKLSLVTEEQVKAALSKQGPNSRYGYHWNIFAESKNADALPVFGHTGSDGTFAMAFPGENAMALFFTQSRGTRILGGFYRTAMNLFNK